MKDDFKYDIISWEMFFTELNQKNLEINKKEFKKSLALTGDIPTKGIDKEELENQLIQDFDQDLITRFEMREIPGFDDELPEDKNTREIAGKYIY